MTGFGLSGRCPINDNDPEDSPTFSGKRRGGLRSGHLEGRFPLMLLVWGASWL